MLPPILFRRTTAFILAAMVASCACADDSAAAKQSKLTHRAVIQQKLTKKIDWNFKEKPLAEAVEFLKKELDLPIHLDIKAIDDLGVAADTPLTFKLSGVSAKTALKFLLRDVGLTFCSYGEVLLITSPDVADNLEYVEVYEVADLVCPDKDCCENADFDALIDLITKSIKPSSWQEHTGPGPISPLEIAGIRAIVFGQTEESHEVTAELLAELREVRHPENSWVKDKPPALPAGLALKRKMQEKIRTALEKPASFHFSKMPLAEAAAILEKEFGIPVLLDHKAICDISGSPGDLRITTDCKDLKLITALDLMFRDVGVTWTVADEVLLISSPDIAGNELLTLVYDVSDLPSYRTEKGETRPDFDNLFDAIARNIHPNMWNGGPGSMSPFEMNGIQALVISQPWQIHEEVRALLDDLHKLRKHPQTKEELDKLPLERTNPRPHNPKEDKTPGQGQGMF
jgi:hypothetical protein